MYKVLSTHASIHRHNWAEHKSTHTQYNQKYRDIKASHLVERHGDYHNTLHHTHGRHPVFISNIPAKFDSGSVLGQFWSRTDPIQNQDQIFVGIAQIAVQSQLNIVFVTNIFSALLGECSVSGIMKWVTDLTLQLHLQMTCYTAEQIAKICQTAFWLQFASG